MHIPGFISLSFTQGPSPQILLLQAPLGAICGAGSGVGLPSQNLAHQRPAACQFLFLCSHLLAFMLDQIVCFPFPTWWPQDPQLYILASSPLFLPLPLTLSTTQKLYNFFSFFSLQFLPCS